MTVFLSYCEYIASFYSQYTLMIKNKWIRILISLLGGSFISETISASTNGRVDVNSLLLGIVVYIVLSAINKSINNPSKKIKVGKEETEILDDDF